MQDLLTRNTTSYVLPAGATTDATGPQNAASMLGAYTAAQASPYSDIFQCNHLTIIKCVKNLM